MTGLLIVPTSFSVSVHVPATPCTPPSIPPSTIPPPRKHFISYPPSSFRTGQYASDSSSPVSLTTTSLTGGDAAKREMRPLRALAGGEGEGTGAVPVGVGAASENALEALGKGEGKRRNDSRHESPIARRERRESESLRRREGFGRGRRVVEAPKEGVVGVVGVGGTSSMAEGGSGFGWEEGGGEAVMLRTSTGKSESAGEND